MLSERRTIGGWGNYPLHQAQIWAPSSRRDMQTCLAAIDHGVARGAGYSQGDSAVASSLISSRNLNAFIHFDDEQGILVCEAGVTLRSILEVFVPRGWFLGVTPGTSFVTVGGAIASDVHGKNHHWSGSFGDHTLWIDLMIGDGSIIRCSRDENKEIFWATIGGMGLTGIIMAAAIRMVQITSAYVVESVHPARNLQEAMDVFAEHLAPYSVAWLDGMARGRALGRSVVFTGRFLNVSEMKELSPRLARDPYRAPAPSNIVVPFTLPTWVLNRASGKAFNTLFYNLHRPLTHVVSYRKFFYPLDNILFWNRMYGRRGFIQYQFVLPRESQAQGMRAILERVARSGLPSFLGTMKLFGPGNEAYLSFPEEGCTLALDFPMSPALLPLLNELDRIVLDHRGRLYLTKDARMSREVFEKSYPRLEQFLRVKRSVDPKNKFRSLQSERLGIV